MLAVEASKQPCPLLSLPMTSRGENSVRSPWRRWPSTVSWATIALRNPWDAGSLSILDAVPLFAPQQCISGEWIWIRIYLWLARC